MPTPVLAQALPASHPISDIQQRSPGDLKPWPTNPRIHSEKQVC